MFSVCFDLENHSFLSLKVTNLIASGASRRLVDKYSVAESDEHNQLIIGHFQRPIPF